MKSGNMLEERRGAEIDSNGCQDDAFSFGSSNYLIQKFTDQASPSKTKDGSESEDDDFEFSFVTRDAHPSSTISADEIFFNGKIRSIFPIFGNELPKPPAPPRRRLPLRKLFTEERESSLASSKANGLEGLQRGTYCVWTPRWQGDTTEAAVRHRKKSNSAGSSSMRWKFPETSTNVDLAELQGLDR